MLCAAEFFCSHLKKAEELKKQMINTNLQLKWE